MARRAGIAGFVTIAGFIVNGYQAPVPELAPIANLTWFGWTVNHLPLAGQFDWPSVAFLAVFVVVLLAIGVWAFVRRDIGVTSSCPRPRSRERLVGLRGPIEPNDRHEPARLDRVGTRHWRLRPRPGRPRAAGSSTSCTTRPTFMNLLEHGRSRASTSPPLAASCSCSSSSSASCSAVWPR